jgi:hypothetical protein
LESAHISLLFPKLVSVSAYSNAFLSVDRFSLLVEHFEILLESDWHDVALDSLFLPDFRYSRKIPMEANFLSVTEQLRWSCKHSDYGFEP